MYDKNRESSRNGFCTDSLIVNSCMVCLLRVCLVSVEIVQESETAWGVDVAHTRKYPERDIKAPMARTLLTTMMIGGKLPPMAVGGRCSVVQACRQVQTLCAQVHQF